CGLSVPGLSLRIVDPETGADRPAGVEGEVRVQGPNVMVGYHGKPEATAAALAGGWYHTGDLGTRDESGFVRITGRIKEVIIRGVENVHPAEIEAVLLAAPGVRDAAVVGVPDAALGQVPVALLVVDADRFDPAAVVAHCRQRLSAPKLPTEFFEVAAI